jgi:hypothetical protein
LVFPDLNSPARRTPPFAVSMTRAVA